MHKSKDPIKTFHNQNISNEISVNFIQTRILNKLVLFDDNNNNNNEKHPQTDILEDIKIFKLKSNNDKNYLATLCYFLTSMIFIIDKHVFIPEKSVNYIWFLVASNRRSLHFVETNIDDDGEPFIVKFNKNENLCFGLDTGIKMIDFENFNIEADDFLEIDGKTCKVTNADGKYNCVVIISFEKEECIQSVWRNDCNNGKFWEYAFFKL